MTLTRVKAAEGQLQQPFEVQVQLLTQITSESSVTLGKGTEAIKKMICLLKINISGSQKDEQSQFIGMWIGPSM